MVPLWFVPIAVACGNSVVIKPSEKDPSAVNAVAALWKEAGLPDGVMNVVHGDKEAVDRLLEHPDVKAVSFVGSTPIARYIHQRGTAAGKRVQALGGAKNHAVVLPDADLDFASDHLVAAAFGSAGERCMAISATVAVGEAAGALVEAVSAKARSVRVGPGRDPATHVGPLVTAAQQRRVLAYIEQAVAEGATLAAQAPVPSDPELAGGYWVAPTLFTDVTPSMTIAREEVFGPVTALMPFSGEDEAVTMANDSPFGLVSAVYTGDHRRARRVARRLETGVVMINNYNRAFLGTPFGGYRDSGYGREHAVESLLEFTRTKNIREPSGFGEIPEWDAVGEILAD
jgi:malonate-semialdehyde dehydrogenase (acetylating) / methylmalonate-semialdehyde dehydrogenase